MKRLLSLTTSLCLAAALSACDKDSAKQHEDQPASAQAAQPEQKTEAAAIGELSVDALAGLLKDGGTKVAVLDSNGPRTREKYGKIPGATLLSDYQTFDKRELPADKDCKLVFYCSNTHCGASHTSAAVAMAEGYRDVNVLPVGIKGWKEAGQKTEAVQ